MASFAIVLLTITSVLSGVAAKQLMFRRDVAGISPVTSALSLVPEIAHDISVATEIVHNISVAREDKCSVAGVPRHGESQCAEMHEPIVDDRTTVMRTDRKFFMPCRRTIQVPGSDKPMPAVGYIGCCRFMTPAPVELGALNYLMHGGRLLDTAQLYLNEPIIGSVVKTSGIPREEIWVTTKINNLLAPKTGTREWAVRSVNMSLMSLGLDYVDVMYLHFGPASSQNEVFQIDEFQDVELWKGLIDAKKAGMVRNIGVCMHTQREIEHLTLMTGEKPAVALFWYSPFMPSVTNDYVSWLKREGIAVSIYGALNFMNGFGGGPTESQMEAVSQSADKTRAQVVIRWALDQNMALITDMHKPEYVLEDMDCSSRPLTGSEIQTLANADKWTCDTTQPTQLTMGCAP